MYLNTKTSLDYGFETSERNALSKVHRRNSIKKPLVELRTLASRDHAESVFVVSSNRTCVCEVGRFGEVIRCDEIVTLRGRLRRPPSCRPPVRRRVHRPHAAAASRLD